MDNTFRQKPPGLKEPEELDFKIVNDSLKKIYNTIIPLLKKEPENPPTLFFVKNVIETCFETYKVIVKLVSDNEKEKHPIQAHMLSRSVIDALFVVMALLDDPGNTKKYERAGYRELWEKYEEEKLYYKDDIDAKVYMEEKSALIKHLQESLKLSVEEIADPKKNIKFWPIPGQFIGRNPSIQLTAERDGFLREIYKWHYKEPSQLNHFAWGGVAMSIFAANPAQHWLPGKYESDAVYNAQLFLLMMLSEVDAHQKYGYHKEIRFLWTLLGEYFAEVKEYYQMRYDEILAR